MTLREKLSVGSIETTEHPDLLSVTFSAIFSCKSRASEKEEPAAMASFASTGKENGKDSGSAATRGSRSRRPASRLRAPKSVEKLKKKTASSSTSKGVLKDANVVLEQEGGGGGEGEGGEKRAKKNKRGGGGKRSASSESSKLGLAEASSAFVEDSLRTGKAILNKKAGTKRFNFPTTRQLESNAELRKAYIMEIRAEVKSQLKRVEAFGRKCQDIEDSFSERFGEADSKQRRHRAELSKARDRAKAAEGQLEGVVGELEEAKGELEGARWVLLPAFALLCFALLCFALLSLLD